MGSVQQVQLKLWKSKVIVGAAAGRYHSVFFTRHEVYTCGLNAGQLGHAKGEKHQTLPCQVSGLADKHVVISSVTCSDGATVCATDKGDIFLLNLYTCRKIISRFVDLTQIAVIGGELDMRSLQEVSKKVADELAVTLLNSRGMVFQWTPKFSSIRECSWCYSRPITVRDFAVGKQLLIVSDDGEAFVCQPSRAKSNPVKTESNRICHASSVSPRSAESKLAQSPPSSLPGNISKDKDKTLAQAFLNTTPLSLLLKDKEKKDPVVEYWLERIPFVYRGQRVFTDSKCRGFTVLQVASNEGLQKLPKVSPEQMSEQLIQLLEEATCDDDIHDVKIIVKGQTIPAHGFVLASRSQKCYQLICENKENCPQVTDGRIHTITLHNNVDYSQVISWLKRLYGGQNTSDKEPFMTVIPPSKGKNGYHSISKDKLEKKNKSLKEKKDQDELVQEGSLSGLFFLSKRELDNFSAPTFDNGYMSLEDNAAGEVKERNALDMAKTNQGKSHESNNLVRDEADLASCDVCESLKFSRSNCPELYDVVIVSEDGTEFKCHKCILVARLEYFHTMLASRWLETNDQTKTLKLPFPTVVLEIVLDFLYTGEARRVEETTDLELLEDILTVADQLLVGRLREICEAVIANLVTFRNVYDLLEFSLLYNANQLRDVCTEYICNNLRCFMEARTLNSLSDEALGEVSRAYRNMVPRMAWRMTYPLDLPDSIPPDIPEPSPGKRRRSTGRKKSSKSESERDVPIAETVQEQAKVGEVHRASVQETEEVFEPEYCKERETNCEVEAPVESAAEEQATQDNQDNVQQGGDAGVWYRKESPESTKSKKRSNSRDNKKPTGKSGQHSIAESTTQSNETSAKKVTSPQKPAWSKASVSSPPAVSLKDIIEQEQCQDTSNIDPVTERELSPPKGPGRKQVSAQSPDSSPQVQSVRWHSGGRQSQKQRKRSKSNTLEESGDQRKSSEGNSNETADTGKEEKTSSAWGGANKEPVPVQSLRDLMQEEEQKTNVPRPPPTPRIPISSGKSGSAKKKLNWRPQPGFYANGQDVDDTISEPHSSVPCSPPKIAWQSTSIACSPPSSSVAFSTILETQEQENTNLAKFSTKPFHLTQLEERAMEELLQYYGGKDNACELITVERMPSTAAKPVWKKERSPSLSSN